MTIAPNGVAIADYDPTGVGAILFCGVSRTDYAAEINFGEIVEASTVRLYAAGLIDYPTDGSNALQLTGAVLPGSWKCLGFMNLLNVNVAEAGSLFIRVA